MRIICLNIFWSYAVDQITEPKGWYHSVPQTRNVFCNFGRHLFLLLGYEVEGCAVEQRPLTLLRHLTNDPYYPSPTNSRGGVE